MLLLFFATAFSVHVSVTSCGGSKQVLEFDEGSTVKNLREFYKKAEHDGPQVHDSFLIGTHFLEDEYVLQEDDQITLVRQKPTMHVTLSGEETVLLSKIEYPIEVSEILKQLQNAGHITDSSDCEVRVNEDETPVDHSFVLNTPEYMWFIEVWDSFYREPDNVHRGVQLP